MLVVSHTLLTYTASQHGKIIDSVYTTLNLYVGLGVRATASQSSCWEISTLTIMEESNSGDEPDAAARSDNDIGSARWLEIDTEYL